MILHPILTWGAGIDGATAATTPATWGHGWTMVPLVMQVPPTNTDFVETGS